MSTSDKPAPKLWNLNFYLLWQGQLISIIGDIAYEIALGFWILAFTGSTALMGSLMAATLLARILLSPFAGVWVDRWDRKWVIVWTDAIRGAFILFVGVAAFAGSLQVWMVFTAGVVLGLCGAFFSPAVSSAIPDIVPRQQLMKANSAFSMVATGTNIAGNSASGYLYQVLGAPLMFLINGISFIVAAITGIFIKIPRTAPALAGNTFWADFKSGLSFVWQNKGIRYVILTASILNFFASMGIILFLPLFQRTPNLGPGLYGILIGAVSGGALVGLAVISLFHIKPSQRFRLFYLCGLISSVAAIIVPIYLRFPVMLVLALIFGVTNSVLNMLLNTILQLTVPRENRGKVFSLLGTLSQGLTPLAFAAGGILAEFIPLRALIASCFMVTLCCFLPMAFMPDIIRFLNSDPEPGKAGG